MLSHLPQSNLLISAQTAAPLGLHSMYVQRASFCHLSSSDKYTSPVRPNSPCSAVWIMQSVKSRNHSAPGQKGCCGKTLMHYSYQSLPPEKKKCTLHHLTISSKNSLFKFVQRKIIKEEEGADGGQKNNVLVNNVLQNDLTEFINHLLLPKGGI